MRCRNEREANAVQRELEELRRVFRERELETQKLVGLIDEARADLTAATDERDQISSEIDATGGAATTRIRELSANLATEQAKRESLLSELDGLIRRKYEIVRQKRGSGLAIAADGMCLSCHISLPPMLYQRIMHQAELFQCPSCQRILYVPREPAIEGSDASARDVESDRSEGEPGASDSEPTG